MKHKKGQTITRNSDGDVLEVSEQYTLSENQARFCNDAEDSGLDIDYTYSGRGMYGKYCPAVVVEKHNDIATRARVSSDSLGLDIVIYAQQ